MYLNKNKHLSVKKYLLKTEEIHTSERSGVEVLSEFN